MSDLLRNLQKLKSCSQPIRKSFGENLPSQLEFLFGVIDDVSKGIPDVDKMKRVINAAWRERNVYLMQCANSREFLTSRKWTQNEFGRWLSPYDAQLYHPARAMKVEREIARRALAAALADMGYAVYRTGHNKLPTHTIEAISKGEPEGSYALAYA